MPVYTYNPRKTGGKSIELVQQLNNKVTEYSDYIDEHIKNIKICFDKYGSQLAESLKVDYCDLEDLINQHDQSKYKEPEFSSYQQFFFPVDKDEKSKDLFDIGWLHHQNANSHHPEFWIMRDDSSTKILDMPNICIAEMLLDWAAMGLKFNDTAYKYYISKGKDKPFSEATKHTVKSVIHLFE